MRTVTLIRLGIFGLLAVGAVVGFIFRDRLTGSADDLRVGDCVQLPTASGTFKEIQHSPCTEPHDAEIFLLVDYPSQRSLPSDSEFETFAEQQCAGSAFQAYTGIAYQSARAIGYDYFTPVESGWASGDHALVCLIRPVDGGKTSQSFKAGG
jgi:hypothetical protein